MLECEPPISTLPTETSEEDGRTRAPRASIIADTQEESCESDDAMQRELLAATRSPSLQLRHDWVKLEPPSGTRVNHQSMPRQVGKGMEW